MSSSRPPPKRRETNPTVPIPRWELPPPASVRDLMEAAYGPSDYETLMPCPACEHCPSCLGAHMVSPERSVEIRREMGAGAHVIALDLDEIDEPGDDVA